MLQWIQLHRNISVENSIFFFVAISPTGISRATGIEASESTFFLRLRQEAGGGKGKKRRVEYNLRHGNRLVGVWKKKTPQWGADLLG